MDREPQIKRRSSLWRLTRYARFAIPSLVTGFILTVMTVGLDLVGPYIISRILDEEIVIGKGMRDPQIFLYMILLYAASQLISLFTRYGGNIYNQTAANHIRLWHPPQPAQP